jgi:hypothetical protein
MRLDARERLAFALMTGILRDFGAERSFVGEFA